MHTNNQRTGTAVSDINSLWEASAQEPIRLPKLSADIVTEVAVIGGGFTGLSAASKLAAAGVEHVLLEANRVGWGASGRNGGMAVLRYKKSWSQLAESFGDDATKEMYRWIHEAVDTIADNVDRFGIRCEFQRYGHLTAAPHIRSVTRLERDRQWLASRVGDRQISIHDAAETARLTGSPLYAGSYSDPRSAGFHPLSYCRGLAQGLSAIGVPIYEGTPASAIRIENDMVVLHTPGGLVRARKVLVCTSAYVVDFDLKIDLPRRVLPLSVAVIGTDPIPEEIRREILPEGHLVTDTKNLVNYYRIVNNRLLFGGRGALSGKEKSENHSRLIRQMKETFPQLRDIGVGYRWSGRIALSMDDFPHLGSFGDKIHYAIGFGGRGVALSHLLGTRLARIAMGETVAMGPMTEARFDPIPFQKLRMPIMHAGAIYYRIKDSFGI